MKRTHKTTKIQPTNYRTKISHIDKYIKIYMEEAQ